MKTDQPPRRKSNRLEGYDYSLAGVYFVTMVTQRRLMLFGEIVDEEMQLNAVGKIAHTCWKAIPVHFPRVEIDEFVVMPNHLHGVIVIDENNAVGATHASPLQKRSGPIPGSLGAIVGAFKSAVTRQISKQFGRLGHPIWQRNYHDRIIRDEDELHRIREYVHYNPLLWAQDEENPDRAED